MTKTRRSDLEVLQAFLSYPKPNFEADLESLRELGESRGDAIGRAFIHFVDVMSLLGQDEREELYTRTFDLDPVCCLEMGWHLFGESYDRGGLMVELRARMRELGVEETEELPDHMANALALLAHMDGDEGRSFASSRVLPAMAKMIQGFKEETNPYRGLLEASQGLIEELFDLAGAAKEQDHV
ncbi:MAG TPA: hypothetical protein ENK43_02830 [Planctomycetes bacterium]|nr:hypothetical protein [Planctomycetota bacterium]